MPEVKTDKTTATISNLSANEISYACFPAIQKQISVMKRTK